MFASKEKGRVMKKIKYLRNSGPEKRFSEKLPRRFLLSAFIFSWEREGYDVQRGGKLENVKIR